MFLSFFTVKFIDSIMCLRWLLSTFHVNDIEISFSALQYIWVFKLPAVTEAAINFHSAIFIWKWNNFFPLCFLLCIHFPIKCCFNFVYCNVVIPRLRMQNHFKKDVALSIFIERKLNKNFVIFFLFLSFSLINFFQVIKLSTLCLR